jgi:hypothetical protein
MADKYSYILMIMCPVRGAEFSPGKSVLGYMA